MYYCYHFLCTIVTESSVVLFTDYNMLLLKIEGHFVHGIRVFDVYDENGIVYLRVQDQETGKDYTISHVLDPQVKYFVWWVVSYDYVMNALGGRVYDKLPNNEGLLEFEY